MYYVYTGGLSQCSTVVRNTAVIAVWKSIGKPRFWTPVAPLYNPRRDRLKIWYTRDYVVGATQHTKPYKNRPSSPPPRQWDEISCSTVYLFIVISCAALVNTFLVVSPPFLRQTTCSGWGLIGVSTSRSKNFPSWTPKTWISRPLWRGQNFRPKTLYNGEAHKNK